MLNIVLGINCQGILLKTHPYVKSNLLVINPSLLDDQFSYHTGVLKMRKSSLEGTGGDFLT